VTGMAQVVANTVFQFILIACTAVSFFVIYKPTKVFHVTHGTFIVLGAYLFVVAEDLGVGAFLSAATAALGTVAFAFAVIFSFRLIKGGESRPLYVLVYSIGISVVVQNVFSIVFGDRVARAPSPFDLATSLDLLGAAVSWNQLLLTGLGMATLLTLGGIWGGTRLGLHARAIADDEQLASIRGIDVDRTIILLGVVSAIGAAVTGMMIAMDTGITPASGLAVLLPGLIASVISGGRGIFGVLLAAFLLAGLTTASGYFLGTKWSPIAIYLPLICFLVWRPGGMEETRRRGEDR
jgi:branched-chain amino acid transport system permease protein